MAPLSVTGITTGGCTMCAQAQIVCGSLPHVLLSAGSLPRSTEVAEPRAQASLHGRTELVARARRADGDDAGELPVTRAGPWPTTDRYLLELGLANPTLVFPLWGFRLWALFHFPVITPVPEQLNQACMLAGYYLLSRA